MKLPSIKIGRTTACVLVVVIFFTIFELQLFNWQILHGETFEQEAMSHRTDAVEISAARGEIWDRDGNVLAGNKIVYEVIYNALYMDDSRRNATILEVIDLLVERGEAWRDILPIELDEQGNYRFIEGQEDEIEILKGRDFLNLADYATADECMQELAKKYRYQGYSKEDTRTVMSVRYSMTKDGFSINDPYVFATGVSSETVGVFGEYASQWPGVETRVNVSRYYGEDGSLAPHVVGYTWRISDKQLEAAEESGNAYDSETNISGYKAIDVIGTSGAEAAFEEELRGKRGLEAVFTDENGSVTSTATTIQPEQGHSVQLTLDSDLQRVANLSLEKNIKANKNSGAKGDRRAHNCKFGAAVAIDVSDFGVLCSSSYPGYDLNRYYTDSSYRTEIINDSEMQPAYNRALQGMYAPGSIFKPMVAIAGLQEGVVDDRTGLYPCEGMFDFEDLHLRCTGIHPWANVYEALMYSCNAYFCELGLQLGIRRLDAYAEYFGLGELTGVELYESEGIMTSPQEYRERHTDLGADWTDGNTAQTAIGQADNMFTPLQLATYCATIANGGVRLRTHFLQQVTDYTGDELIRRYEPEVLKDAVIRSDVLAVVNNAMVMTATDGLASSVFGNYPVPVACKTGTAQTSGLTWEEGGTEENITFIAYAPAQAPEIAVAVVLEHGSSGNYAMNVAKDILDCYFGFYTWDEDGNRYDQDGDMVDDEGNVLKTKEELEEEAAAKAGTASPAPTQSPAGVGGEGTAGEEPTPSPTPTPWPGRGSSIPNTPYTGGNTPATPAPGEEEAPAGDAPTPTPGSIPYYYGQATHAPSASPEPSPSPPPDPDNGDG
ncbi:penicillin-binding transpeptidase domain-containing protein [Acutalibacter caecimuris]|uniref:penicillin-binding transpeptidase domain-containing protein n=1 Tax=Acutalibacter caecimuris TaxID=3093657 RepID=UPI002AC8B880|nr:penicillin-binding transpeptidase domain-containing protein [Acutalibacter sp. M00118]